MPIYTTELFWDCECEVKYIHPKSEVKCAKCGAMAADQPDSRSDEVIRHLNHEGYTHLYRAQAVHDGQKWLMVVRAKDRDEARQLVSVRTSIPVDAIKIDYPIIFMGEVSVVTIEEV